MASTKSLARSLAALHKTPSLGVRASLIAHSLAVDAPVLYTSIPSTDSKRARKTHAFLLSDSLSVTSAAADDGRTLVASGTPAPPVLCVCTLRLHLCLYVSRIDRERERASEIKQCAVFRRTLCEGKERKRDREAPCPPPPSPVRRVLGRDRRTRAHSVPHGTQAPPPPPSCQGQRRLSAPKGHSLSAYNIYVACVAMETKPVSLPRCAAAAFTEIADARTRGMPLC